MKISKLLSCLMLVTILAACSSDQSDDEKENAERERKEIEARRAVETYKPKLICPQVAIIRELGKLYDYGNENAAPAALVVASGMEEVTGTCSYKDDGIDVAFTLKFKAARGARANGDEHDFPFFVAVLDASQAILNKNEMTTHVEFGSNKKPVEKKEDMHVFIPLAKDKQSAGPNYRVLIGFQLTPKQLAETRNAQAARLQKINGTEVMKSKKAAH